MRPSRGSAQLHGRSCDTRRIRGACRRARPDALHCRSPAARASRWPAWLSRRRSRSMGLLGDLLDPAFLEDPYPTYARLLTTGPVMWDDEHRMWLVSGHPEFLEALKRPETSVATAAARIRPALGERAAHFEPLIGAVSRFLTRVDPPDHTRLRALVQKAFTLSAVERMHDDIASLVDG